MRNFFSGFAVVGLLVVGAVAPAAAHPRPVPAVGQSLAVRQADWDGCGARCQEHRREVREREQEHERWVQHRRGEEHRGWEEGRQYSPQTYDHQHRY
jgi:hypothetical protein